jgi:hypothetical protein
MMYLKAQTLVTAFRFMTPLSVAIIMVYDYPQIEASYFQEMAMCVIA